MKRFIAIPATCLTATLVFAACSGPDASMQPGDSTIATLPTASSSAPTTSASSIPSTTIKPTPTTTVKRVPSTTIKPTPTTVKPAKVSGTPEQLAAKAAVALGNAVDDALEIGARAPIYQTIWDQYAAAGMKITIPVAMRAPDNPNGLPSFSAAYQLTSDGKTFCLLWVSGNSYETHTGACG